MSADLEYRKRVAYHEAGHTIQYLLACARDMQLPQIHKVSILPDTERDGVLSRRAFYPLLLFNMHNVEHRAVAIKRTDFAEVSGANPETPHFRKPIINDFYALTLPVKRQNGRIV